MTMTYRWRNPHISWKGGSTRIPAFVHQALVQHIERGENPFSDFLDAVLENDLKGAVHAADAVNLLALPHVVGWLYNYAPAGCQGSPEKVAVWRKNGGLVGLGLMEAAS